jgi:hypothetical protein
VPEIKIIIYFYSGAVCKQVAPGTLYRRYREVTVNQFQCRNFGTHACCLFFGGGGGVTEKYSAMYNR